MIKNLLRLTGIVLGHILEPHPPDTSPCGKPGRKTRADNFPKGDCSKPRVGRHNESPSCSDRYWQDSGARADDDGVRCGDKRYPLGRF